MHNTNLLYGYRISEKYHTFFVSDGDKAYSVQYPLNFAELSKSFLVVLCVIQKHVHHDNSYDIEKCHLLGKSCHFGSPFNSYDKQDAEREYDNYFYDAYWRWHEKGDMRDIYYGLENLYENY